MDAFTNKLQSPSPNKPRTRHPLQRTDGNLRRSSQESNPTKSTPVKSVYFQPNQSTLSGGCSGITNESLQKRATRVKGENNAVFIVNITVVSLTGIRVYKKKTKMWKKQGKDATDDDAIKTAVVSFQRRIFGTPNSIDTHFPSLPIDVPESSSNIMATWGTNHSAGIRGSTFKFFKPMRGVTKAVSSPVFIPEHVNIKVSIVRAGDMVPLGIGTLVVSGERKSMEFDIPVKKLDEYKRSKLKQSFHSDKSRSIYEIGDNTTLRVYLEVTNSSQNIPSVISNGIKESTRISDKNRTVEGVEEKKGPLERNEEKNASAMGERESETKGRENKEKNTNEGETKGKYSAVEGAEGGNPSMKEPDEKNTNKGEENHNEIVAEDTISFSDPYSVEVQNEYCRKVPVAPPSDKTPGGENGTQGKFQVADRSTISKKTVKNRLFELPKDDKSDNKESNEESQEFAELDDLVRKSEFDTINRQLVHKFSCMDSILDPLENVFGGRSYTVRRSVFSEDDTDFSDDRSVHSGSDDDGTVFTRDGGTVYTEDGYTLASISRDEGIFNSKSDEFTMYTEDDGIFNSKSDEFTMYTEGDEECSSHDESIFSDSENDELKRKA